MKIVFDIEAVENIVSKLRTNYENQTKQKSLMGGESQAISAAWDGQSATAFSNKVNSVVNETVYDVNYDVNIAVLEIIKDAYSNVKDEVSKLSKGLKSLKFNIYNNAAGKPMDVDLNKSNELKQYFSAVVEAFECFKGMNRQSIDIIKSAWKDGDEINLIEVLENCDRFYSEAINSFRNMMYSSGGGYR